MKKKIFLIVTLFVVGLLANIISVNAESKLDKKTLDMNNKMSKITAEIDKQMKDKNYPSFFGGTYISDDSSYVILQIVKNNIPTKYDDEYEFYNNITNLDENIVIEYVKNSYKDLDEINHKLVEYYSSKNSDISNLGSHYFDIFTNKVVVELFNVSDNKITNLKNTIFGGDYYKKIKLDSDVIVFKKGKQQHNHATTLKAGRQISVPGGSCSMGYRVKISGNKGYITAGHCFTGIGNSATGGTVTRYQESGTVDAAFVQTTSSYTPSNSLQYTSGSITKLDNTLCPILSVNQSIAKAGYSTGYTSGQIKNLNYSGTYDGIYFTNLIAADYSTSGGDSGGAVFVPTNTTSGGTPVAGINKGTSSYGSAFVDANQIYFAFGYTRY